MCKIKAVTGTMILEIQKLVETLQLDDHISLLSDKWYSYNLLASIVSKKAIIYMQI